MTDDYAIEQGPRAVAELFVDPPAWLVLGMIGVAVVVVWVSVYVLARDGGLDVDTAGEVLANAAVAGAAFLGTKLSVAVLGLPYVGDVLVGAGLCVVVYVGAPDEWFERAAERLVA